MVSVRASRSAASENDFRRTTGARPDYVKKTHHENTDNRRTRSTLPKTIVDTLSIEPKTWPVQLPRRWSFVGKRLCAHRPPVYILLLLLLLRIRYYDEPATGQYLPLLDINEKKRHAQIPPVVGWPFGRYNRVVCVYIPKRNGITENEWRRTRRSHGFVFN